MKTCTKCHLNKDDEEFSRKRTTRDGLIIRQSYCKECVRESSKLYYQNNREKYLAKNYRARHWLREKVFEYLRDKRCVDCGEGDPIVLEFDHVRGHKKGTIRDVLIRTTRWEKVLEEIAKCEIRCANCHRRKTVAQFNHHRGKFFGI